MPKTKNNFPSEKDLKKVRSKLSRVKGSNLLAENANVVDRAKHDVCKEMVNILRKRSLTQRQLASLIQIPETRVSEIVHYHIEKFTLDKLLSYLEKVKPNVTLKVA